MSVHIQLARPTQATQIDEKYSAWPETEKIVNLSTKLKKDFVPIVYTNKTIDGNYGLVYVGDKKLVYRDDARDLLCLYPVFVVLDAFITAHTYTGDVPFEEADQVTRETKINLAPWEKYMYPVDVYTSDESTKEHSYLGFPAEWFHEHPSTWDSKFHSDEYEKRIIEKLNQPIRIYNPKIMLVNYRKEKVLSTAGMYFRPPQEIEIPNATTPEQYHRMVQHLRPNIIVERALTVPGFVKGTLFYNDRYLRIYSTRDIEPGDELLQCYHPLYEDDETFKKSKECEYTQWSYYSRADHYPDYLKNSEFYVPPDPTLKRKQFNMTAPQFTERSTELTLTAEEQTLMSERNKSAKFLRQITSPPITTVPTLYTDSTINGVPGVLYTGEKILKTQDLVCMFPVFLVRRSLLDGVDWNKDFWDKYAYYLSKKVNGQKIEYWGIPARWFAEDPRAWFPETSLTVEQKIIKKLKEDTAIYPTNDPGEYSAFTNYYDKRLNAWYSVAMNGPFCNEASNVYDHQIPARLQGMSTENKRRLCKKHQIPNVETRDPRPEIAMDSQSGYQTYISGEVFGMYATEPIKTGDELLLCYDKEFIRVGYEESHMCKSFQNIELAERAKKKKTTETTPMMPPPPLPSAAEPTHVTHNKASPSPSSSSSSAARGPKTVKERKEKPSASHQTPFLKPIGTKKFRRENLNSDAEPELEQPSTAQVALQRISSNAEERERNRQQQLKMDTLRRESLGLLTAAPKPAPPAPSALFSRRVAPDPISSSASETIDDDDADLMRAKETPRFLRTVPTWNGVVKSILKQSKYAPSEDIQPTTYAVKTVHEETIVLMKEFVRQHIGRGTKASLDGFIQGFQDFYVNDRPRFMEKMTKTIKKVFLKKAQFEQNLVQIFYDELKGYIGQNSEIKDFCDDLFLSQSLKEEPVQATTCIMLCKNKSRIVRRGLNYLLPQLGRERIKDGLISAILLNMDEFPELYDIRALTLFAVYECVPCVKKLLINTFIYPRLTQPDLADVKRIMTNNYSSFEVFETIMQYLQSFDALTKKGYFDFAFGGTNEILKISVNNWQVTKEERRFYWKSVCEYLLHIPSVRQLYMRNKEGYNPIIQTILM